MERATIARPYAKALFEIALSSEQLSAWSDFLMLAVAVVQDKRVVAFLENPKIDESQKIQLLTDITSRLLPTVGQQLFAVLAHYHRLFLLPEIAVRFETLRQHYEKEMMVQVESALPLSDAQQQALSKALSKKLQRKVILDCHTKENLLGGVVIRAGDLVINGSARDKLARLAQAMLA